MQSWTGIHRNNRSKKILVSWLSSPGIWRLWVVWYSVSHIYVMCYEQKHSLTVASNKKFALQPSDVDVGLHVGGRWCFHVKWTNWLWIPSDILYNIWTPNFYERDCAANNRHFFGEVVYFSCDSTPYHLMNIMYLFTLIGQLRRSSRQQGLVLVFWLVSSCIVIREV